jgi:hypothetical protein
MVMPIGRAIRIDFDATVGYTGLQQGCSLSATFSNAATGTYCNRVAAVATRMCVVPGLNAQFGMEAPLSTHGFITTSVNNCAFAWKLNWGQTNYNYSTYANYGRFTATVIG